MLKLLTLVVALATLVALVAPFINQTPWTGVRDRCRLVALGFSSELGVVTLAEAKLATQDDLDAAVIDEFRKSSVILDSLIWHDAVNPMGGGTTLTYGYHRVIAQRPAAFRAINSEYTPAEATKQRFSVDLKPLGGSFQIDRVLNDIARGAETGFQLQQLIKATTTRFADELINGDTAVDANGFDGLDKALVDTWTEIGGPNDISDWTNLDGAGVAQGALDRIDEFLASLDGEPTLILGNRFVLAKARAIARRANMYTERPVDGLTNVFGVPISRQQFGNIVLADPGDKAGSTQPIIPLYDPDNTVKTLTVAGTPTGGTFTLKVSVDSQFPEETAAIAYNANAAAIQAAIIALPNVPAGGATVTGTGPFTVTFSGDLAGVDVDVTLEDNALTGGTAPTITIAETGNTGGYSDLYAVRIGMDGFHGVSAAQQDLVRTWLPNFTLSGAVKTGEAEMGPVSVVLKATRAAAVLRNIKVR